MTVPMWRFVAFVMLTINLSGGQEVHPTSHLEAVANEIFYCQRSFPQVLHWREEEERWKEEKGSRNERKIQFPLSALNMLGITEELTSRLRYSHTNTHTRRPEVYFSGFHFLHKHFQWCNHHNSVLGHSNRPNIFGSLVVRDGYFMLNMFSSTLSC